MVASVSTSCFAKVAVCLTLLFALADCRSFEDFVHNRGLKRISTCSTVYEGTDWVGGDINTTPVTGLGMATECCAYCNRRYGTTVMAYTYRTDSDSCYCKDQVNLPSQCSTCQGRNENEQLAPANCNAVYNYDRPGNDLPRMPIEDVTQPGDCCQRCRDYGSLCVAWTWRRDGNRCYLKRIAGSSSYCGECVVGTR